MKDLGELRLDFRELATNHGFTEGPVADGETLYFTSINRGTVFRVPLSGGPAEPVVETGGGPNGATIDARGDLWVAQNGGHVVPTRSAIEREPSIQRIRGGVAETVASGGYYAPNDCAFGPDGRLWFTDPAGSTESSEPSPGRLWALDTATGKAELILDGLLHPNGLAFNADGSALYLCETRAHRLIVLTREGGRWRRSGAEILMPIGEPDGLAFDVEGRLWVAGSRADVVVVFEPRFQAYRLIRLGPSFPTNVCFAGRDHRTVVLTLPKGGRVLAARVDAPGLPLRTGAR